MVKDCSCNKQEKEELEVRRSTLTREKQTQACVALKESNMGGCDFRHVGVLVLLVDS